MLRKIFLTAVGAWAWLIAHPAVALACSVCVDGAANDPVTDGFNSSVLFLMATPYLVVGSIVGWLVYSCRRAAPKRETAGETEPVVHLAWNQKESGR